jgi:hypothetical protein
LPGKRAKNFWRSITAPNNMIRSVLSGIAFIFFLAACSDDRQETLDALQRSADEINAKCPQMLDSETRLDGLEVKAPDTLVYRYTLINLLAAHVDTSQFYRALWPGIISNIKVSPEMKRLRQINTVIEYDYRDKNRQPVYTFTIGPQHYK